MIRLPDDTAAIAVSALPEAVGPGQLEERIAHVLVFDAVAIEEGADASVPAVLAHRDAADVVATGRVGVDARKMVEEGQVTGTVDRDRVLTLGEPVVIRREALEDADATASVPELIESLLETGASLAVVAPDGTLLPEEDGDG